jgi:hypothetical protein
MASKSKRARLAPERNYSRTFKYWAIAILAIKAIIIINIQGGVYEILGKPFLIDGIWLGADGENYLQGFLSLTNDGIFSTSEVLSYWPAGYPILMLFLSIFSGSWMLTVLSILQSAIFSWAVFFFALQLLKTKIKNYAFLAFLLILLNTTISLSSLAIGYESLTASGFLITTALIAKDLVEKDPNNFRKYVILNSIIVGVMALMQPRLILSGLLINFFWILLRKGFKRGSIIICISLIVTSFFPGTLVYRNNQATGITTISTNLGNALNIGAGDQANGGYMKEGFGVPCTVKGSANERNDQLVKCDLNWYTENPGKALVLFYKKSVYFWSPWINNGFAGDVYTGTMFRNPWLEISPITNIAQNQDGARLVYGNVGKIASWLWLTSGLILMIYGFFTLWRQKSSERLIAIIVLSVIIVNWIIALMTIGDHRFRIPILGMSIFLQTIGIQKLFRKKLV